MSTQQKATEIVGRCRGRWSWDGRVFTSQGVEVPPSVLADDEARYADNLDVAPDEQVLSMKVTLPKEALPAGFELSPVADAAPEPSSEEPPAPTPEAVTEAGGEKVEQDPPDEETDSARSAKPAKKK